MMTVMTSTCIRVSVDNSTLHRSHSNSGYPTPSTTVTVDPDPVQHRAAPCDPDFLGTPDSWISHSLSRGFQISGHFSSPELWTLCAHSSSQCPPFLAHISSNRVTVLAMTPSPSLLTMANPMVAHTLFPDPVIAIEQSSTPPATYSASYSSNSAICHPTTSHSDEYDVHIAEDTMPRVPHILNTPPHAVQWQANFFMTLLIFLNDYITYDLPF